MNQVHFPGGRGDDLSVMLTFAYSDPEAGLPARDVSASCSKGPGARYILCFLTPHLPYQMVDIQTCLDFVSSKPNLLPMEVNHFFLFLSQFL